MRMILLAILVVLTGCASESNSGFDAESLASLAPETMFSAWESQVDDAALNATREAFGKLQRSLLELGTKSTVPEREASFHKCVQRLNEINMNGPFIFTMEREELCESLEDIALTVGLPQPEVSHEERDC